MDFVGKINKILNIIKAIKGKIKIFQAKVALVVKVIKTTIKFPHFLRKLPANFFFSLIKNLFYPFLLLVLLLNLGQVFIFPDDEEKILRYELLKHPTEAKLHERLGYYYLGINYTAAKREYLLAEEFYRLTLSKTTDKKESPWQRWTVISAQRERLKKEALFWDSVRQAFPDYYYAPLKLAAIHFLLGNDERAKEYIQVVLRENPTEESALHLYERLK